uniref:TFIID subunit TAF5 NTD2 domain-containing protein n=1 Tax=Dendroctonus ponderosae TaxID=77166 RepID=A0AAR5PW01_DENPD
MDDNKSHVKSVVSVYINRRQLSYVKPRIISKRNLLKQTSLRARISRTAMNSFVNYCDDEQDEDDQLLVEYSFMFQKFMHWLKEQTDQKQRCYDIEKIVGPLFCHLYLDIQHNNKYHEESSNLFFKTHIDKIDRSKCDSNIQDIITGIEASLDNMGVLNGTDNLVIEDLRNVFRSTKIVVYLKSESLKLLKQFISWKSRTKSHMVMLQAVQSWFDLKEVPPSEGSYNFTEDISKKPDQASSCSWKTKRSTCSSANYSDETQSEDQEDDDQLLIECQYSFMYQKLLHVIKEQTDHQKYSYYDLENLAGPLFCSLYMKIRDASKSKSEAPGNLFFKTHIKTVLDLKPESLKLLTEFMASHRYTMSGVKFAQRFQTWFDQGKCKFEKANNFHESLLETPKSVGMDQNAFVDDNTMSIDEPVQLYCEKLSPENNDSKMFKGTVKQNSRVVKMETDDFMAQKQKLSQQKSKIRSVIKKIRKLPAGVGNFRLVNTKHFVTCGIVRSNAGLVAFVERNILKVMPAQMLADHVRFIHHSKQIYCIALCPNNEILCTGSADRTICVYSLSKFKLVRRLFGHLGPVYSLAISRNSKYLASGSHDGTARLWSLRSGKLMRIFAGHSEAVMCADFHPNSLYLATGSADRNIRVWCLNNAKTVRLLHAAKKEIYSVVFSPNGQYLASSDDRRVEIWNLANSKIFHEYKNRESVFHLAWSKSGKQLCGGTASGVVKIWEVRDKDKEHVRDHKHSHSDYVLRRYTNGRLLALDYTLCTWICLSIPNQPFIDT